MSRSSRLAPSGHFPTTFDQLSRSAAIAHSLQTSPSLSPHEVARILNCTRPYEASKECATVGATRSALGAGVSSPSTIISFRNCYLDHCSEHRHRQAFRPTTSSRLGTRPVPLFNLRRRSNV